jgi:hypothetical protein
MQIPDEALEQMKAVARTQPCVLCGGKRTRYTVPVPVASGKGSGKRVNTLYAVVALCEPCSKLPDAKSRVADIVAKNAATEFDAN